MPSLWSHLLSFSFLRLWAMPQMSADLGFLLTVKIKEVKCRLETLYVWGAGAYMLKGSRWVKVSESRGSREHGDPSKCWKPEGLAPRCHFPHQLCVLLPDRSSVSLRLGINASSWPFWARGREKSPTLHADFKWILFSTSHLSSAILPSWHCWVPSLSWVLWGRQALP